MDLATPHNTKVLYAGHMLAEGDISFQENAIDNILGTDMTPLKEFMSPLAWAKLVGEKQDGNYIYI